MREGRSKAFERDDVGLCRRVVRRDERREESNEDDGCKNCERDPRRRRAQYAA
jgi:hypothetical protein